jgi:NADH-quinone oxidoreductase subunit L
MVAAGVFLVLRLYSLFDATPMALNVLFWIGATTALVAGLIATSEMDLKRVLAWSAASQLGEMMIALGLGCRSRLPFIWRRTRRSSQACF